MCKDVRVEPPLNPLSGEKINQTTNTKDDARLDIAARGFWTPGQKAFYDVRVFNPIAKRYRNMTITKACELNEKEKKRNYNQRILEVEHGSFTPIVFTAMGGMGRETKSFYKRLSELLSDKRNEQFSITTSWVRRKVIFALLRSVILCLRGSRIPWSKDHLTSSISNNLNDCEQLCSI